MTCGHVCLATINLQLYEIGFTFNVVIACLPIFPSVAMVFMSPCLYSSCAYDLKCPIPCISLNFSQ